MQSERVQIPLGPDGTLKIGVISDTHIPDRARHLHPGVMAYFREAGVGTVLHGGDVAVRSVLEELGHLGPVIAVRGNRDWLLAQELPLAVQIQVGDVEIGLAHGHGGMLRYFLDKYQYFREGYKVERYRGYLRRVFPEAKLIVFGHTHRPECVWKDGTLFFNPGAAGFPALTDVGPTIGLLEVGPGDAVRGRIVALEGLETLGRS
ncbi:MAG TPA: metallophosphoesterase family protein [Anaerolineaceae bacterium]